MPQNRSSIATLVPVHTNAVLMFREERNHSNNFNPAKPWDDLWGTL